jgi:hypothetical protein
MNNQKPSMFIPALVGGGLAGVLAAVPFVNCLCCIWIIGGAMLAAYLLVKETPSQLSAGDGAIVGIFTGIIAAIVELIVSIPFRTMENRLAHSMMERFSEYLDEMPSGWENFFEGGDFTTSMGLSVFGLFISAVLFSALGALGGVLGISLFGKKPAQPAQGQGGDIAPKNSGDHQS